MDAIRVAVVGYGTIGKRVCDAVLAQSDMCLIGVVVRTPVPALLAAAAGKRLPYYCEDGSSAGLFSEAGLRIHGDLSELLAQVDVVVDCTPRGKGANRVASYARLGVPAIFQGGERPEIASVTFSSFANYEASCGKRTVRVASCMTTGLARLFAIFHARWGVVEAYAALIRCATDPNKAAKGVVNGALIEPGYSHHMRDLQLMFGDVLWRTQAISVPMTHGHIAMVDLRLKERASREEIICALRESPRILIEPNIQPTCALIEGTAVAGRSRGDRPEVLVWEPCVCLSDDKVCLQASIHMESIVVPENIDCIRAVLTRIDRKTSIYQTDTALGIAKAAACYQLLPG